MNNKSFDQGRNEIAKLCQYFSTNRSAFLSTGVKEAHVRQTLIDPLFEALGWDVRNIEMIAPQYREVVPEDSLDMEGHQRAPDYSFRVGTLPKFFAEAKKCGINIETDQASAYQIRSYGWSAKVPLSILTDFEELSVYDCTSRPRLSDKASHARIQYFRTEEYPDRWRELWDVFSREAVWSGLFDQYGASKRKHGTSEVDAEFLKEIEGWRDELARNIALRNPDITFDDLNGAVQRIIDRIVFLRMAEDRGLEPYRQLLKLCERSEIYARFANNLCRAADEKYNSGLFHFQKESNVTELPDRITPKLNIDDKTIKPILQSLYFEHGSPYSFGVLPVEILGTVYERFLGKVIRLTVGHQAKIEEKPEVRKAGGVYYTPAYIVDFIVKHTIETQIEKLSPAQLAGKKDRAPFRIVDMACGSGSFLLGAYQSLLDHCLKWYLAHTPASNSKSVYKDPTGQFRLTIEEKKRILTTHIFGVDIDSQAVEVSKLSLLLKALEGENEASLSLQFKLFHERALPNLSDNIKRGNSIIGPDYFSEQMFADVEEYARVKPFDWKTEFPEAAKAGGFDCIIGNPPYLKIEHIGESDRSYLSGTYKAFMKRYDTYGVFVEKAIDLLKNHGCCGMIIPSTVLNNISFRELRKLLLQSTTIQLIVNLGGKVFKEANNDTLIPIFKKGKTSGALTELLDVPQYGGGLLSARSIGTKDLVRLATAPDYLFELRMSETIDAILSRMKSGGLRLGDICSVFQGFVTGGNEAYIVDQRAIQKEKLEKSVCKPAVFGDETPRYAAPRPKTFVIYLTKDSKLSDYPNVGARLEPHKAQLQKKREVTLGRQPWYSLHWPRVKENFERSPKILVQAIRNLSLKRRIMATLDFERLFADHTLNVIYTNQENYDLKYVLGILNSDLINFIFLKKYIDINIKGFYLSEMPIAPIDFTNSKDVARHLRLVQLVDKNLEMYKLLDSASSANHEVYQRQIEVIESKIDCLVYDLYGLTEEEIEIIRSAE